MSVFVPYTYIDLGVAIEEEEDLDARGVTSKIMSKSRSGCHVAIEQDVQNPRNIYWPFLELSMSSRGVSSKENLAYYNPSLRPRWRPVLYSQPRLPSIQLSLLQ